MKYFVSLIILFLSINACAATSENELLSAMNQSVNAWNRGDIMTFLNGYKHSDDVRYVSTTIIKGYDAIQNRYQEKYPDRQKMGKLSVKIDFIKKLSSEYALVGGYWRLTNEKSPAAMGVFTLLFEKTAKGWKIIVDHSS